MISDRENTRSWRNFCPDSTGKAILSTELARGVVEEDERDSDLWNEGRVGEEISVVRPATFDHRSERGNDARISESCRDRPSRITIFGDAPGTDQGGASAWRSNGTCADDSLSITPAQQADNARQN